MTHTNTAKIFDCEYRSSWNLNVDLSKYRTSGPAAKALHKALQDLAERLGQDPDRVLLVRPEDDICYVEGWGVSWEEGPYEWALRLENVRGPWGFGEPGYSFNLHMVDDRRLDIGWK